MSRKVNGSRNTLLGIAILATLTVHTPVAHAQDLGIAVGTRAPAATVETLNGKSTPLEKLVGKGPALIEFWATWCPNCRELEPVMKAAHARYGRRVRFVGVAVSVDETPAQVQAFVAKHDLSWTQAFDRHGRATAAYDVSATSFVVVLDGNGRVAYTGVGGKQDLGAALRKVLGDKKDAAHDSTRAGTLGRVDSNHQHPD